MELNINDVIFREDLYPRFEPNQQAIQKYSDAIEYLPPIKVNQDNILIDGFHRWKGHQLAKVEIIKIEVIETISEKELKKLAYELNSNHGIQLTNEEKKRFAIDYTAEYSINEIAKIVSVSERTVREWTERKRKEIKNHRNKLILEEYLRAWNTQEAIAEKFRITQPQVVNIINNGKFAEIDKDFEPYIYNIWRKLEGNETGHFGSFPTVYMENLLYYQTKPLDIIYDPFAGNGTTVDICKKWFRRYYCSDLIVKPGREKDILQHDIKSGIQDDLQKPNLVFLDPPYWKQAEKMYSDLDTDLGNMDLDLFNKTMELFLNEVKKRKIEKVAIVIQPTQYKNNFCWTDHIFDFNSMLPDYEIKTRYILPYSTQQYNAQMVEKAKELNQCLCLHRDLVVWGLK